MRIFSLLLSFILSFLFSLPLFSQTVTTLTGHISASGGVNVDKAGQVYVADYGVALNNSNGSQVLKLNPASGNLSIFARGLSGASGNDFDSKGNLFQSNIAAGTISKISPSGVVTTFTSVGISGPVGIVIDEGDTLYVCNCGNNSLRKVWPSGQSVPFSASTLLSCPNGITRDPQGNLYVANFNNGDVLKVTPDKQVSRLAVIPGNRNGHLTYSPEGYLLVASHGSHSIYKVSLSGDVSLLAGTGVRGIDDGPALQATFSAPNGIATSATGDTAYVNCTIPTVGYPPTLNPSVLRMITGLRSPNGLEDLDKALSLRIGPIPAKGKLGISLKVENPQILSIKLFGADGKQIQIWQPAIKAFQEEKISLSLPDMAPGSYQLSISGDSFSVTRMISIW